MLMGVNMGHYYTDRDELYELGLEKIEELAKDYCLLPVDCEIETKTESEISELVTEIIKCEADAEDSDDEHERMLDHFEQVDRDRRYSE
ncbi:hypothetical protein [Citrobacter amalonaticus]|uniref:hypothetical protein n=2 Tax=Enterobacteriaceae TaxID=543 RepID=UPI00117D95B3|nr:hypothetical protein [Citrobacter amalonaticus]